MTIQNLTLSLASLVFIFSLSAQTVSDFEGFTLGGGFDDGAANPLGYDFIDGNVAFENYYDTSWGGYWSGGFAISSVKDSSTAGFTNLFACFPGTGQGPSSNYAVANNFAKAKLQGNAKGKLIDGLYISNSTFAVLSMRNGDNFAKKFGGADGNDPDWFKIEVFGLKDGNATDTVEFYLADFRFSDNSQDYIVEDWQWLDLKPLGNVDEVLFVLSSSDTGSQGMNTPAFFAIDNFKTLDSGLDLDIAPMASFSVYPNPAQNHINFSEGNEDLDIEIFNASGEIVWTGKINNRGIDISNWKKGMYLLRGSKSGKSIHHRFIVE